MQNAHLRLGLLEYHRITEKTSTRIRVRVSSYIGEDEQAHLIGVFGNDSDIGAITAAVHEKACFTLTGTLDACEAVAVAFAAAVVEVALDPPGDHDHAVGLHDLAEFEEFGRDDGNER